jgi:hypothetical protein
MEGDSTILVIDNLRVDIGQSLCSHGLISEKSTRIVGLEGRADIYTRNSSSSLIVSNFAVAGSQGQSFGPNIGSHSVDLIHGAITLLLTSLGCRAVKKLLVGVFLS